MGRSADLSKLTLAKRADIPHETNVAKNAQASGDHSWSNPDTKETYMKMYNEYHRLRSGYDTCHGCRFLPALYKTYRCVYACAVRVQLCFPVSGVIPLCRSRLTCREGERARSCYHSRFAYTNRCLASG